jgi:hypothetical protein
MTEDVKQVAREYLDLVVNHYHSGNRSMVNGNCLYFGPNNKKCAVALIVNEDYKHRIITTRYNTETVKSLVRMFGKEVIKEEFRVLADELEFLRYMQSLHDEKDYWGVSGLTHLGMLKVNEIKGRFEL